MTPSDVKRPSIQFYPGDWRRDLALRTCSIAARGLLIELMCVMHDGDPYGHLAVAGTSLADKEAAAAVGIPEKQYRALIGELLHKRVLSQTADGMVFSRRMVRDEHTRSSRARGGESGAEHGAKGAEHGSKGGRPRKPKGGFETPLRNHEEPPFTVHAEPPKEPPPAVAVAFASASALYPPPSPNGDGVPPASPPAAPGGVALPRHAEPPIAAPSKTGGPNAVSDAHRARPRSATGDDGPLASAIVAVLDHTPVGAMLRERPHGAPQRDATAEAQGITDPDMLARRAAFAAALDDAVAGVPHLGARMAMRRLLDQTRADPARWPSIVRRMSGWQQGLATTGMKPVSWEAIDEGINELLDEDATGQKLSTLVVLSFVEKAERRRAGGTFGAHLATTTAPHEGKLPPGVEAAEVGYWRRAAEKGVAEYVALCQTHGIAFEPAAASPRTSNGTHAGAHA